MLKYTALALSLAFAAGCSEENDESVESVDGGKVDDSEENLLCKGRFQDCPSLDPEACRANPQCISYSVKNAAGERKYACVNDCKIGVGVVSGCPPEGSDAWCVEIDGEYYGEPFAFLCDFDFRPEGWNRVSYEASCKFLFEDEEDGGVPE